MSVCRSCGKFIVWGETKEGKKIPLDQRAPVYRVIKDDKIEKLEKCYVTHFATCPDANQWSKTKSGEPPPERHYSEPQGGDHD